MAVTQLNGDYITIGTVGASGLSVYMRMHVTTYTAFGDPLAFVNGSSGNAYEYDANDLYFYNGTNHNILTGDDTSWIDIAVTITAGGSGTAYYKAITASSWSTAATFTAASTDSVVVGAWPFYGPAGTHETSAVKIWDAVLTTTELLQEATQMVPVRWLNLRFWNPFIDAANCHKNQLSGGSDGTVSGTPASSTSQSSLMWKRQNALDVIATSSGVTSTGSIAMSSFALSGTATETIPSSGTFALQSFALAGSALVANPITSSGDIALSSFALAGSGSESIPSSGTLAMQPYALDGAASESIPATGSIAMQPYGLGGASTVTNPITSDGSIAMQPYGLAGSSAVINPITSTGSIALSSFALAGVADLGIAFEVFRTTGLPPNRPRFSANRATYWTGRRRPVRFTATTKRRLGQP